MSLPRDPEPCTVVCGLLLARGVEGGPVLDRLAEDLGPVQSVSEERPFAVTDYYAEEMGAGVRRLYAVLAGFADPAELADRKLTSNRLEASWTVDGRRTVNLDPGLLNLAQVTLATCKAASQRIYLRQGVYAEVQYQYRNGTYVPLPWTYPDYRESWAIEFFNGIRRAHRAALRAAGWSAGSRDEDSGGPGQPELLQQLRRTGVSGV